MTTPKDLVKTNDYCAFCIESSETWKNLARSISRTKYEVPQRTKWEVIKGLFKYEPLIPFSAFEKQKIKLEIIQSRLDLLLTEYYRTQYYSMYDFSSIEIHPDLRDGFFSWCHDKLKGKMDIH